LSTQPHARGKLLIVESRHGDTENSIRTVEKKSREPIQIKYFQTAVGLDIDCFEGRVYWSDISGMAIRSSTYNGSAKSDFITQGNFVTSMGGSIESCVAGIGSPEGLAVDWVSRNIYWTDSTKDTVEVASVEGKRRRVLFDTNLVNPRGIAVHPQRG
jgi:nidogen (entactin)